MVPREVYGVSFRWVIECRVIRGPSTDYIRHGLSTGPVARDVHGFLGEGQSASRNYFQFGRHRCFLRYPSFGTNKPGRSLLTLHWLPIELMGKGNDSTLVNGFSSGHASLQPCQRVLGWLLPTEFSSGNLNGGAGHLRHTASLPLAGELPRARWLALPRGRQDFCTLHWQMKEY